MVVRWCGPVFGDNAYGGILAHAENNVQVIARDGLQMRLQVIRKQQRFHLLLDNDGFAAERPITIIDDLSQSRIQNRESGQLASCHPHAH